MRVSQINQGRDKMGNVLTDPGSGTVRERAEHNTRAADARTTEPPFSLQLEIQLSRCRIPVGNVLRCELKISALIVVQLPRGGSNERRRLAISHFPEDFHGRCSAVLDGGAGLCPEIHTLTGNSA